jgi:hypothetical protein
MPDQELESVIRTALYIDFDNVFLSLSRLDQSAADRFAREPLTWLKWFEDGNHELALNPGGEPMERRILVRRCYLNPAAFQRYRAYFTRNGFAVIDCPPLTSQNKNGADIYMVMDILDALNHTTRFDEFIILSSDADFTPILTRLREHDRRSTIISNAITAAALKSACDYVVPEEIFLEDALEAEQIDQAAPEAVGAPARYMRRSPPRVGRGLSLDPPPIRQELIASTAPADLKRETIEGTRALLARSPQPILLSRVGLNLPVWLRNQLKLTKFCGHGSLARLLKSTDHSKMVTVLAGASSYVYDPSRHEQLPKQAHEEADEELGELRPELVAFIRHVHEVVGLPPLQPDTFRTIFETLTRELQTGAFSGEYELSGRVRDSCQSEGQAITRANIGFVIKGLSFARYDLNNPSPHWIEGARAFCDNTERLCRNAGLMLSQSERELLIEWLVGKDGMPMTSTASLPEEEGGQYEIPMPDESTPAERPFGNA